MAGPQKDAHQEAEAQILAPAIGPPHEQRVGDGKQDTLGRDRQEAEGKAGLLPGKIAQGAVSVLE